MNTLQFLIEDNKINDAVRLIKWRKQILKAAQLNGWQVANMLAKKTVRKMQVDTDDFIQTNL